MRLVAPVLAVSALLAPIATGPADPATAPFVSSPAPVPPEPFYVGGIQVHERDHDHWAETLAGTGMNTVAVTVYAKQGDWDGDELWFAAGEPAVIDEIRAARARGLSVALILRVSLQHGSERNKFLWHGQIMPATDALLASWFEKYAAFARKWARIGEREGVEVLGIGSEMKALAATLPVSLAGNLKAYFAFAWYQRRQRRRALRFAGEIEGRHLWVRGHDNYENLDEYLDARYEQNLAWAAQAHMRGEDRALERINRRRELILEHWADLIAGVRRVYGGKLTYAANFDNYRNVGFWHRLDLIGINAYFSLRAEIDEDLDAAAKFARFTRAWGEILTEVRRFKDEQKVSNQPVLFTEVGYTFRRHSTVEPWAHDGFSVVGWKGGRRRLVVWGDQPVDREERKLALQALDTVRRRDATELAGILYWKLSTDRSHEEIEPFVLHIGPDSEDELQDVLAGFVVPAFATE